MPTRRQKLIYRRPIWLSKAVRLCLSSAMVFSTGCRHPRDAEYKPQEKTKQEQSSVQQGKPAARAAPNPPSGSSDPKSLPVSPAELFVPGGIEKVQSALDQKGYKLAEKNGKLDSDTIAAIDRFQEREGLAKTGVPDRETLKRLGLDPEKLYQKKETAKPKPAGQH